MLFSRRFAHLPKVIMGFRQQPKISYQGATLPVRFSFCAAKAAGEKMEFKAETKKLLDIVAKSLYTDS